MLRISEMTILNRKNDIVNVVMDICNTHPFILFKDLKTS